MRSGLRSRSACRGGRTRFGWITALGLARVAGAEAALSERWDNAQGERARELGDALAVVGTPASVPVLQRGLDKTLHPDVIGSGAFALARIGAPDALAAVQKTLDAVDDSRSARLFGISWALAELRSPDAIPVLWSMVNDARHPEIARACAIDSLGRVCAAGDPYWEDLLAREFNPRVAAPTLRVLLVR